MQNIWALALLLLCAGNQAANTLGKDIELPVSSEMADKRNILGFTAFIGIGKETENVSQMFEHNFGRKETVVGRVDAVNWGIACADPKAETTNTCVIDDDAVEKEDYFFNNKITYKNAHLYLRFFAEEKIDTTNLNKLPIELVTAAAFWPLNKVGVIGLRPNGDFANYMRSAYDGDNSLLFGYNIADTKVSNEALKFDNHVVINPVYTDDDVVTTITVDKNSDFWTAQADVSIENSEVDYKNTTLCFTSQANELIAVVDSIVQCDRVRAATCGADKKYACKAEDAAINKAPTITIKIGDDVLTFTGDQYIYFDANNNLSCRFGDLSDLTGDRVCPDGTEVAVGRTFFSVYYPSLTFSANSQTTMTLLSKYNFNPHPTPDANDNSNIFLILGIIAAIIVTGLIIYFFVRKRNDAPENEGNYANL